jgi:hypothetical protein
MFNSAVQSGQSRTYRGKSMKNRMLGQQNKIRKRKKLIRRSENIN